MTANEMVIEAFEKSKYSGEDLKREIIAEFGNRWYLACIKLSQKPTN
ncbi:MAG: hypothetical protein L3J79_08915 [Candidatus Marinimicrobia bacterium]|nr:hypothetical protein [Candidatus Neomarinimicrobiota bacterium]